MIMYSHIETPTAIANKKLDELIDMMQNSMIDNDEKESLKIRFNEAVNQSKAMSSFREFKAIGNNQDVSRREIATDIEFLLNKHDLDSNLSKKYLMLENLILIVQIVISLTLAAIGFGLLILPVPSYLQLFRHIYFLTSGGVTLMDVFSLLIIFTGIYLLISSFLKLGKK